MVNFEAKQRAERRRAFVLLAGLFITLAGLIWSLGSAVGAEGSTLLFFIAVISTGATWVIWRKADAIVLKLARAEIVDPHAAPQLHNIVEELCIAAGLPKPRVAVIDDPASNAFATGRDPSHAVVSVTTGLLGRMDREELQGVLAHELEHIANRDTLVMTAAATTAGIITLFADLSLRLTSSGSRQRSSRGGNLLLAAFGMIAAPLAAALLTRAGHRTREELADATAVQFTRNPAGLRRALQKLAVDSTVVRTQSPATAHLWIESSLDGSRRVNRWYRTHPPIQERIGVLWQMEGYDGFPPPLPGEVGVGTPSVVAVPATS